MAGLAERAILAQRNTVSTSPFASSSRPTLPNGPCNHRDATTGPCGCDQFWDKYSADLHDQSTEQRPGSDRSTWCVCGHHACFHLRVSRATTEHIPALHTNLIAQLEGNGAQAGVGASQFGPGDDLSCVPTQPLLQLQQKHSQAAGFDSIQQGRDTPSQASTTGLPGIPSICMLSHDRRSTANRDTRHDVNQSQHNAGLGLSTLNLEGIDPRIMDRQPSPDPTIPDDVGPTDLSRGILNDVLEFNRNLQVDVPGDTIPNTYNPEDYIQSATEVATPSVRNTPDLSAADQAVQEGKDFIDALTHLTSLPVQPDGSPDLTAKITSAPGNQLLLTNSPSGTQQQLQNLLRTASPQGLQKLVSYLGPLHNLLNSIPNVANTMRDLGSRLDVLEGGSFNYVQPEDLNTTLELYEGRLIDVEQRMDEHERYHQAIDAEQSTSSFGPRRIENGTASFASNQSGHSVTSSALVLAAMERKETETELENIKDRLEMLEAAALPSFYNAWEVEVVFLPWGRDLRGIWFSPDEPLHNVSGPTTQDSEEWTQARAARFEVEAQSPRARGPYSISRVLPKDSNSEDTGSGWSSQAISDWASESEKDWLFPKGCGSNNLVYKRLKSRGFVRDVTLKAASARDIQSTLANAFSDLLEHLSYSDHDQDPIVATYPGLQAPFIPLRKVFKESKLRFLTPAEMSSSAHWGAQFLAAGVMMRVSGGKKRLYVTHREAYIQQDDTAENLWTWPEIRQLPRYQGTPDSQMEANEDHYHPDVPEADAKEPCWQFVETYDAPPLSVHSSFGSNQSISVPMRPAGTQWRRSITPSSILKNKQPQPISPFSEHHHQRPIHFRNRTASASVIDTFPPASSKRRLHSSPVKQSSAPQVHSRAPSVAFTRSKRRRVTNSSSPQPEDAALSELHVQICNPTPRRSREPPSPFFASQPALRRTTSDLTSRPSQRSVAVVGKSTPFAYATPYSGPVTVGHSSGIFDNGGDTEPDDDDVYNDNDSEASWRGVEDGEDDSAFSSSSDARLGAEDPGSFSGDDSGFESHSGDEDDDEDYAEHSNRFSGHQQISKKDDGYDDNDSNDEDEDDVFDSLLDVLES